MQEEQLPADQRLCSSRRGDRPCTTDSCRLRHLHGRHRLPTPMAYRWLLGATMPQDKAGGDPRIAARLPPPGLFRSEGGCRAAQQVVYIHLSTGRCCTPGSTHTIPISIRPVDSSCTHSGDQSRGPRPPAFLPTSLYKQAVLGRPSNEAEKPRGISILGVTPATLERETPRTLGGMARPAPPTGPTGIPRARWTVRVTRPPSGLEAATHENRLRLQAHPEGTFNPVADGTCQVAYLGCACPAAIGEGEAVLG